VQEFGGAVHLASTSGRGTRFTVELPTSIAITRVFLFSSAGQTFALMATFIDRVGRLDPADLIDTTAGQAVVLQDRTVPVADAADLLRLGTPQRDNGQLPMLVVAHGGRKLTLIVDALIGERELTIKPLGRYLSGIRGVSGAAMLEDGTVVLVLHASDLVTGAPSSRLAARAAAAVSEERVPRVLLVEDSLITRELERSMLASLGLTVVEAVDGVEALEKLEQDRFDLIVADVEMPRLDGFELTRQVKQDERWAQIPVILVTTRGTAEDKKRGLDVGADAYVVKSEFKSKSFIETVRRFLP
jgi:two-component system chemotaxis sensor kinase CheA